MYGGTGSANAHVLAAGWQTIASRLRQSQMADDTRGPLVRLTQTNGAIYVAWVEVDQNKPPYSGLYTPAITQITNLSNNSPYECQFLRVGDTVTVSGKVGMTTVAANTLTLLSMSLPVTSNLGADEDCAGTAFAYGTPGFSAAIQADTTNDRALMIFWPTTSGSTNFYFQFTYQVI